jgi:pimeloyl-ACP methyl ester carboxylesterase
MPRVELNARIAGQAGHKAVVLLHGLFGSAANWGAVARQLAGRFHVLVPDLRNHGQSPHAADASYPAMVDDLLGLLDRHALEQAVLVGHSMGGKVVMHFALNHPQRVERLAVVDMSPVRYTHDFEGVLAGFRAVDLAAIRNRADADRQMAATVPVAGVRAFLLQNLAKGPDGWGWRLNLEALAAAQAMITGFPRQPPGAVYDGPVSFIYGALSDYVTPAYESRIRDLFPGAELCPVAGAGHWVYADKPQGFMACLERFLAA